MRRRSQRPVVFRSHFGTYRHGKSQTRRGRPIRADPTPAPALFDRIGFAGFIVAVMFETYGDTPWGYGLARLDKDSGIIWSYLGQTHHDFDIAGDGRIYVLTHEMRDKTYNNLRQIAVPRLDDAVTVLSPDGEELKEVFIMDVLVKSEYARLLDHISWFNNHDFIHTNAVEYITAEKAAVLPFASEGQILLSFRDVGALAILDLGREKIVWARRGDWAGQHDPDVLPNGHILLFDNLGKFGPGGRSRILEIDPQTSAEVWRYQGSAEAFFESDARASQERQPNGNTLVTEAHGGRLFEVTPDGRIVWEYINPRRATHPESGDTIIPIMSWAQRVARRRHWRRRFRITWWHTKAAGASALRSRGRALATPSAVGERQITSAWGQLVTWVLHSGASAPEALPDATICLSLVSNVPQAAV